MEFATIKIPAFGGGMNGEKLQILLPDGRDITEDLFIQRIEIMGSIDDFTLVKLTCCTHVEVRAIYPAAFDSLEEVQMGLILANAVRHSGWR